MEYDLKALKRAAVRAFMEMREAFPDGRRLELWRDFRKVVVDCLGDNERDDMELVIGWNYEDLSGYGVSSGYNTRKNIFPFECFHDYGPFRKPTFTFRMACWAIRDGIVAYDAGGTIAQRNEAHYQAIRKGWL